MPPHFLITRPTFEIISPGVAGRSATGIAHRGWDMEQEKSCLRIMDGTENWFVHPHLTLGHVACMIPRANIWFQIMPRGEGIKARLHVVRDWRWPIRPQVKELRNLAKGACVIYY